MTFQEELAASIIGSLFSGSVVAFVLGAVLAGRIESVKQTVATRHAYDEELRTARMKAYQELWSVFAPTALHAPAADLTYAMVGKIGEDMRECYFRVAGLLLTKRTRAVYFLVQEEFDRIRELALGDQVIRPRSRLHTGASLRQDRSRLGFSPLVFTGTPDQADDEPWVLSTRSKVAAWTYGDSPDDDYVAIQFLASSLRTQLVFDIQTRDSIDPGQVSDVRGPCIVNWSCPP